MDHKLVISGLNECNLDLVRVSRELSKVQEQQELSKKIEQVCARLSFISTYIQKQGSSTQPIPDKKDALFDCVSSVVQEMIKNKEALENKKQEQVPDIALRLAFDSSLVKESTGLFKPGFAGLRVYKRNPLLFHPNKVASWNEGFYSIRSDHEPDALLLNCNLNANEKAALLLIFRDPRDLKDPEELFIPMEVMEHGVKWISSKTLIPTVGLAWKRIYARRMMDIVEEKNPKKK